MVQTWLWHEDCAHHYCKETYSPGDAMRDIYTRGLVTSDFVLVMGDLVSNVRIDEVVKVHKERRKNNKDAIMTMVVKESGVRHRTRCGFCLLFVSVVKFFLSLGLKENLQCLSWTARPLNVCITCMSKAILVKKLSIFLAKC
jgi:hypothetical protein